MVDFSLHCGESIEGYNFKEPYKVHKSQGPFMKQLILLLMLLTSTSVFSQSKVAVVKLLRGEVDVLTLGKTTPLKKDDWVEQGAVIKTADKSFVKLIFLDKSQMNVGPNSEMKIEKFSGKDSGVIDLVKGKIRSQVTKDYLQIKDKDKSKLFIKTQNAVMGVRGTDFMIATNGATTSTILFEGEVVFNRLDNRAETSSTRLEEIVDRGVRMYPGEFSVQDPSRSMPTVPALLNIQQREKLETNQEFDAERAPSNSTGASVENEKVKSVVPEGLSGQAVSNNSEVLKSEVTQVAAAAPQTPEANKPPMPASSDAAGYVNGEAVKPANGSYVHVDSGVIVGPGPDSVLDSNTNTYIPGKDVGSVATNGEYVPPKNIEITADGKVLMLKPGVGGPEIKTIIPPPPIVKASVPSFGKLPDYQRTTLDPLRPPGDINTDLSTWSNDQLNSTGGITGVNDPTRIIGPVDTTIIVNPQ